MADAEHEHLEKVSSLSLKDLRALVKEAGLSSDDCIEKAQLRLRAAEAVERLLLPGAKLGPIGKSLGLVATAAAPASGAAGLAELLGDTLLTKEGEVPVSTALAGKKHIMLYFSAHWCPPCKQYTPELARAYTASTKQAEVAIVFVSSDRDQKSFDSRDALLRAAFRCAGRGGFARGEVRHPGHPHTGSARRRREAGER